MRELLVVRHGESEHLATGLTGGWTNAHLTERGRAQARLTGARLARLLRGRSLTFCSSDLHTSHLGEMV